MSAFGVAVSLNVGSSRQTPNVRSMSRARLEQSKRVVAEVFEGDVDDVAIEVDALLHAAGDTEDRAGHRRE